MKKYRTLLCGICLLFLAVPAANASKEDVARVEKTFMEGKYDAAVSEADRLLSSHYGPADELYYLKGLGELKLKRFDAARESFQYIESKYPGSRMVFDARLGTGDSYMLAGDLSSAVGIYVGMLDNFRSNKNLSVVYSRLASCYKGLGVKDKAEYYQGMASQSAPLSFEAKGQVAVAQARATASQAAVAQVRAPASPSTQTAGVGVPAARPKVSVPVSNIRPKDSEEMDVLMATGQTISVQVGSFKNRRNAEKLAQRLAASGYESRIEIPVAQGEKLYRVKVGRVSSKQEAEALKTRLVAAGYSTKICDGETCE